MKFSLPDGLTRTVGMTVLKTKKNSPTILFVGGLTLGVATVVSACKSTLKVHEVTEEHEKNANMIRTTQSPQYSEMDRRRDMSLLYMQTSMRFVRLYGPAVLMGVASVACLTQSHRIQNQRIAGLMAAYTAVDKAYEEYRARVRAELGEDKDREFAFGVKEEEVMVEGKNGLKKKKVRVAAGPSKYARIWSSQTTPNWVDHREYAIAFIKCQQKFLNDKLRADGSVMLNDAYDALGLDRTPAGTQVGWLWNKGTGDNEINFGLWEDYQAEKTLDFMSGVEDALLLDFNVDGPIWRDI